MATATGSRSYEDAVACLNTLQSNAAAIEASRASGGRLTQYAIPEMIEYLGRIGYAPEDLNKLNVIHVTGTKGKGSTCAFIDSLLRHAMPQWKIGLYTSPHLVAVRERIRINGAPVGEADFAKYFFEVWDLLEKNSTRADPGTALRPGYFRFLTLLAFHIFTCEKVDATILEVGIGGMYDSTNIVPKPVVTGISNLGIDHTSVLGKTLGEIAWQKGGIFKEGVPAFTVNQPEEGLTVLRQQSIDRKSSDFTVLNMTPGLSSLKLGLEGKHQIQNANLGVHLAQEFLRAQAPLMSFSTLDTAFVEGLRDARWPGRCQTVVDPDHAGTSKVVATWFLDGAHTVESLDCCQEWFVSPDVALRSSSDDAHRKRRRTLIFNCTSGRSGQSLLGTLLAKTASQLQLHGSDAKVEEFFDDVVFCTNVTYADGGWKGDLTAVSLPPDDLAHLKTQNDLASVWRGLVPTFPDARIHVMPSIEHAIRHVREVAQSESAEDVDVLVTGSLHLIGGVIEVAGLKELAL